MNAGEAGVALFLTAILVVVLAVVVLLTAPYMHTDRMLKTLLWVSGVLGAAGLLTAIASIWVMAWGGVLVP